MTELLEQPTDLIEEQTAALKGMMSGNDYNADQSQSLSDTHFEDDSEAEFKEALNANGSIQRSLDATQLYLNEIGFSLLLSA